MSHTSFPVTNRSVSFDKFGREDFAISNLSVRVSPTVEVLSSLGTTTSDDLPRQLPISVSLPEKFQTLKFGYQIQISTKLLPLSDIDFCCSSCDFLLFQDK